jgi:hypothetical protein
MALLILIFGTALAFLEKIPMASAGCESTSASCASAIYIPERISRGRGF